MELFASVVDHIVEPMNLFW